MKPSRSLVAILLLLAGSFSASPVVAQATFHEAYALALENLDAGRFEDARVALERAIELRPEAGRRIRTYGLNFLDLYTPYLHLARVELELGHLNAAERHLETSRAQGVAKASELEALAERLRSAKAAATPPPSAPPPPVEEPPVSLPPPPPTLSPTISSPPTSFPPPSVEQVIQEQVIQEEKPAEPKKSPPPPPPPPPVKAPPPESAAEPPAESPAESPPAPPPGLPDEASTTDEATNPAPAEPTSSETELAPPWWSAWWWWIGLALVGGSWIAWSLRSRKAAAAEATPRAASSNLAATLETPATVVGETTTGSTLRLDRDTPTTAGLPFDFGSYRLKELLGTGGMARTYLASRRRDDLQVAIKIPHEHLLADEESNERFLREGGFGATLHHPGIVRIFEAAQVDGRPFIAMEYLEGRTLADTLRATPRLEPRRALEIARGVALALDYAHLKGVVHRDLKPDNIMILTKGDVKVMDYGIARILDTPGVTTTGTYLGTPVYSAPEALGPEGVERRSDLYSLGIILYQMLVGKLPFWNPDPLQLLLLHREQPLPEIPLELGLPPGAVTVVRRLTEKSKDARYATAEELLRDLDRLLVDDLPTEARALRDLGGG